VRVLLVPNTANPAALNAVSELASWLVVSGLEPVVASQDASECGLEEYGAAPVDIGEPVLVVALGGDGTILKAVHLLGEREVPILGANLGRLGFMAGTGAERVREAVEAALAGEGRIERRRTLAATVSSGGRQRGRYRALNEAYVGRGTSMRVVDLELLVNGTLVSRLRCDGIIVATSTGSTAYALSAGGPIVSPDLECMVVVHVAPHTVASRALVVGPSDRIDIGLSNPARRDAYVSIDGTLTPRLPDIESVKVVLGEHDVLLVRLEGRDFYEIVRSEFLRG